MQLYERERERERERGDEMESNKNLEMIKEAIRKLMEEEQPSSQNSLSAADKEDNEKTEDHHRRKLLSKLLSELESSEEEKNVTKESKQDCTEIDDHIKTPNEVGGCSNEEIIKELKNVKRQNVITHGLLAAMIVLTLAWQLSEVSLILAIKDGFSNPLKSIGGIIRGFLKRSPEVTVQDKMKQASGGQKQVIEPASIPGFKIPEIPHLELPGFESSDED